MRRLVPLLLVLLALPAHAAPRPGFSWPLQGSPVVTRGFQPPQTRYGVGHRGVDLGGYVGEHVLAAGPGRVSYAGLLAGRGVVTVTHSGGLRTTYEPVTTTVHVGDQVAQGDVIGRLSTGHAACRDVCLHWGLLRGETYLDPLGLVQAQQVRLLPLGDDARPASQPATALQAAPADHQVRSTGALAAGGALAVGVTLLASRRRPSPQPPPRPVDLLAERARRRAA